jgi:hypothetical protein
MDNGTSDMTGVGNAAPSALPPAPMTPAKGDFSLGTHGLVKVRTAEAVAKAERDAKSKEIKVPKVSSLVSLANEILQRNSEYRQQEGLDARFEEGEAVCIPKYTHSAEARLVAQDDPLIRSTLTMEKVDDAHALLTDVFLPGPGERSWALLPSPVPELSDAVKGKAETVVTQYLAESQENGVAPQLGGDFKALTQVVQDHIEEKVNSLLKSRTQALQRRMEDQLLAAGWDIQLSAVLRDLLRYPYAVIEGPVLELRRQTKWNPDTGEVEVKEENLPVFRRIAPRDFYPPPVCDPQAESGPFVERIYLSSIELGNLVKEDGYYSEAIERILDRGVTVVPESQDADAEIRSRDAGDVSDLQSDFSTVKAALKITGDLPGEQLINHGLEKGLDGKLLLRTSFYYCQMIVLGDEVIFLKLLDPADGRSPYSILSWVPTPGGLMGQSLVDRLHPLQLVCDGAMRSATKNLGYSAGPQVVINDIGRLAPGEDLTTLTPLRVWQFVNENQSPNDPVKFVNVPMVADKILGIHDGIYAKADGVSGVPKYDSDTARTAGRTSSGLNTIIAASSKRLRAAITHNHLNLIYPCLQRLAYWNLQYTDDPSIQGDSEVIPTGAVARAIREQLVQRRMEFLNMTNNPIDTKLVGANNRAKMIREIAEALHLSSADGSFTLTDAQIEELVKKDEAKEAAAQQAAQQESQAKAELSKAQAQAVLIKAQADQLKAQTDSKVKPQELEIRKEKILHDKDAAEMKVGADAAKEDARLDHQSEERTRAEMMELAKMEAANDSGEGAGAGGGSSSTASTNSGLPSGPGVG